MSKTRPARSRQQWIVRIFIAFIFAMLVRHLIHSEYLTGYDKVRQLTSLIEVDCLCKSLFTIGGCNGEFLSEVGRDNGWAKAVENIFKIRNGAALSLSENLHHLSRYLKRGYSLDFNASVDRLKDRLPYVPCDVHIYTAKEVSQCLKKRNHLTGRNLQMAFVGDSLVRSLMEVIVMNLKMPLNLTAGDDAGIDLNTDFLDDKAKFSLPVSGNGLDLRLYWAVELGKSVATNNEFSTYQGAREILMKWAASEKEADVPDIIYFDEGMWSLTFRSQLSSLATVMTDFEEFRPVFKRLSGGSVLLLRTQTILKEYLAKKPLPNGALDLIAQLGWATLNDAGVWFWDTPTPLYLREYDECEALVRAYGARKLPKAWGCADIQHPSKMAEQVVANMIWNLVCNRIMGRSREYCCTN